MDLFDQRVDEVSGTKAAISDAQDHTDSNKVIFSDIDQNKPLEDDPVPLEDL